LVIGNEEGRLFMLRYDEDKDQRLNYKEFSKAILPVFPENLGIFPYSPHTSIADEDVIGIDAFSYDTKMFVLELFRIHFEVEKAAEK
jgi:hypothetical protein